MEPFLFFFLGHMLFYGDYVNDPVHTVWFEGRSAARQLECEQADSGGVRRF